MQTITVECQECAIKKAYETDGVAIIGRDSAGRIGLITHEADHVDLITRYADRMAQDELRGLITGLLQVEINRFGPGEYYVTAPTTYIISTNPRK